MITFEMDNRRFTVTPAEYKRIKGNKVIILGGF